MEGDEVNDILGAVEQQLKKASKILYEKKPDSEERKILKSSYRRRYYQKNKAVISQRNRDYYHSLSPQKKKKILERAKARRLDKRHQELLDKLEEIKQQVEKEKIKSETQSQPLNP